MSPKLTYRHDAHEGIGNKTLIEGADFMRNDGLFNYFIALTKVGPDDARQEAGLDGWCIKSVVFYKKEIAYGSFRKFAATVTENRLVDACLSSLSLG